MGYSRDALKGLGWIGLFRIGAKGIIFFKVISAYRYLSPREVGLFGICAIALGLLEMITETGINIILVRDTKPLSYYIDTAFIVSIIRGVLISFVLMLSAFFLPQFFRDDALFTLLLWISVIPLIKGFINPAIAKFTKDLQYNKEALLRLFLILFETITAIILVRIFQTAQSLVWSMVSVAITEVVISFALIKPWPRLRFNKKVCMEIVNPGKWLNLAGIFAYAEQNFDNLMVGRLLGSTQLGYYQTAFNLGRSLITEIGTVFSQVLVPIMGRIKSDPPRLKKAFLKMIVPAGLVMLIPLFLLNFPPFQEFLLYFLQEKWRPILPLLPYLTISAWLAGTNLVANTLFVVKDHIKTLIVIYGLGLSLLIFFLYSMTNQFGIIGAVQAVLITRLIIQPIFFIRTYQILKSKS